MDEKPRLNTNNSSSKMSSVVFMSRGKTIADIYDGEYFEVVSKQENLLVVRYLKMNSDFFCKELRVLSVSGAKSVDQRGLNYAHRPSQMGIY